MPVSATQITLTESRDIADDQRDFLAPYADCMQALRAWLSIDASEVLNAQVLRDGETAGAWYLFGAMRLLAGDTDNIKPYFLACLQQQPDCREALDVLTALEARAGATEAANDIARKLQALIKGDRKEIEAEKLYNEAAVLLSNPARHADVTRLLAGSLELAPWRAKAWLGLALTSYGKDVSLCAKYAGEALIRNPLLPDAWAMAIAGLAYSKDISAAGRAVGRSVSLFPDNPMVLGMISVLHEVGGAYNPGISRTWYTQPEGRIPTTLLKMLLDRRNENAFRIRKNSVLKAYGSISAEENSIMAYMKAITLNLMPKGELDFEVEHAAAAQSVQAFAAMKAQIAAPAQIVGLASQWAIQGKNDRDMRVTLATTLRKACPALTYTAPTPAVADKLRIAVIDGSLASSNALGMQSLVGGLDIKKFSVRRFYPVFAPLSGVSENDDVRILPASLNEARTCVTEFSPHVVIFSSLNIHPWLYQLAFSRLAPTQISLNHYPATTGIDTIDYVISAAAFESANAQEHYSEKLIALPSIGVRLAKITITDPTSTRAELSLPEKEAVFLCSQPIYKLLPSFTSVLAVILRDLPNATVVMLDAVGSFGKIMHERLDSCDPTFSKRVKLLGRLNHKEYASFLRLTDVILDGFPTSAGFALSQAIVAGTPIVTYCGDVASTRLASGMLEHIGLTELSAETPEAYAALAVKLGSNTEYRQEIGKKMRAASPHLFDDDAGIRALEHFLLTLQPTKSH